MWTDSRTSLRFLLILALVVPAFLGAQTGNLATTGRFDDSSDVDAWLEVSSEFHTLSFSAAEDADGCLASGVADEVVDPPSDFGTGESRFCLGGVSPAKSYNVSGDFRFPSAAYDARANLSLTFWTGADCTGDAANGLFVGYAVEETAGWQHLSGGPVTPDGDAVSGQIRILFTQIVGVDPAVEVLVDNVRVTESDWVFADGFEVGETCRWSTAVE